MCHCLPLFRFTFGLLKEHYNFTTNTTFYLNYFKFQASSCSSEKIPIPFSSHSNRRSRAEHIFRWKICHGSEEFESRNFYFERNKSTLVVTSNVNKLFLDFCWELKSTKIFQYSFNKKVLGSGDGDGDQRARLLLWRAEFTSSSFH